MVEESSVSSRAIDSLDGWFVLLFCDLFAEPLLYEVGDVGVDDHAALPEEEVPPLVLGPRGVRGQVVSYIEQSLGEVPDFNGHVQRERSVLGLWWRAAKRLLSPLYDGVLGLELFPAL